MQKDPILQSRRFWTAIMTLIIDLVTFAVAHYVPDPNMQQMATMLIGGVTTIGGLLIASYTIEDHAIISNQAAPQPEKTSVSTETAK